MGDLLFWMEKHQGFAAWVAALGTFLAFGGAIFLAIQKDRQDKARSRRRAYAIAAGLAPRLDHLVSQLMDVERITDINVGVELTTVHGIAKPILAIKGIDITAEELGELSILDGDHAFRLARASGLLTTYQAFIQSEVDRFVNDANMSKKRGNDWGRRAQKIRAMFQSVANTFGDLAKRHASDPSSEEVWGGRL